MKKRTYLVLMVFFIMLISTSIVQAGFFDFLTGRVVTKSYISCIDSDGGKNYNQLGNIIVKYTNTNSNIENSKLLTAEYFDSCQNKVLTEYFCNGKVQKSIKQTCENGCENGACIEELNCSPEGQTCGGITGQACCGDLSCQYQSNDPNADITADGSGVCVKKEIVKDVICTADYHPVCGQPKDIVCVKAPCDQPPVTYSNMCNLEAAGAKFLYEGECRGTAVCGNNICEEGEDTVCPVCKPGERCPKMPCEQGSCLQDCKKENICADSDGGKNYYVQGTASVCSTNQNTETCAAKIDSCSNTIVLNELYCDGNQIESDEYKCPYGCKDGTCLEKPNCSPEGQTCGGITGQLCCGDLLCQYPLDDVKAGVTADNSGVCVKQIACTKEYKPVCGQPPMPSCKEGVVCTQVMPQPKTYSNLCVLNQANAKLLYEGACKINDKQECSGCLLDNTCLPFGIRTNSQYCDISRELKIQLVDGDSCQNNFECQSNSCMSGQCGDLKKELAETKGMLQKLLDWMKSIFG